MLMNKDRKKVQGKVHDKYKNQQDQHKVTAALLVHHHSSITVCVILCKI